MANKETARKALEVIRAWTSLENPRASCRFLIAYAALAHIEDGTGFSEILYIRVSGPRDGKKTQTGAIAADLVGEDHCVVVTAGTTSAVFFRMIDARHKLVVVDEADELPTGIAREIARIARAGYRTGAKVYRCDGPIGTKSYGVYGPKMFIGVKPERDAALRNRMVELRAVASTETEFRFTQGNRDAAIGAMRSLLEAFGEQERANVLSLYNDSHILPEGLSGRLAGIARPLIAVARRLDSRWPGFHFERIVRAQLLREHDLRQELAEFDDSSLIKSYLNTLLDTSPTSALGVSDVFTREALQDFFMKQDRRFRQIPGHIFTRMLYESGYAVGLRTRKRVNGSNPLKHIRLKIAAIRKVPFQEASRD
mgnify:FL=1